MQHSNKYKPTTGTHNIDMLSKGKTTQRSAHSINLIMWNSAVDKNNHVPFFGGWKWNGKWMRELSGVNGNVLHPY